MSWLHRYRLHLVVFVIYIVALAVAYFPLLHKNFAADDFRVLWRVCHHGQFVTEGFFRIMSDLTIYFNYQVGGYQPFYFNLFNDLVHLACSLLICHICLETASSDMLRPRLFAFCAGLFFLLYPFHSEGVVWIVGRGASLSTLFALIAISVSVSGLRDPWKYVMAGLSYLLGLLAYESILSLPLIILAMHWAKYRNRAELIRFALFFAAAALVYFIVRIGVSGSVLGAYGAGIAGLSLKHYVGHFARIMARLIAPPNPDSSRFVGVLLLAFLGWAVVIAFYVKGVLRRRGSLVPLGFIGLMLLCSIAVAVSFPVSTRTSSTDRLLYFPSVFLCVAAAMIVAELAGTRLKRVLLVGVVVAGSLWGIMVNSWNWRVASDSTGRILGLARELSGSGIHLYLINVPDEHMGAYMLAGVLDDALLVNGVDTAKVTQVNVLLKEDDGVRGRIRPVPDSGGQSIFPGVRVEEAGQGQLLIRYAGRQWRASGTDQVWYWDREAWRRLE